MTLTNVLKTRKRSLFHCAAATVTVLLAMVAGATAPVALAQEAAAQAPNHGPEGSWIYTVTIPGFPAFQGVETYAAGGGYSEADQLSFTPTGVASAGHGAWKSTGEKTFLLSYLNLTFDGYSTGNPTGYLSVRQTTKIDSTGNSYTGSGVYTYMGTDGKPLPGEGETGTFTITAVRITVVAP